MLYVHTCLLCSTCNIKHSTTFVYMCKNQKKKKNPSKNTSERGGGQHILKSDQIMVTELSTIQSASAVSSLAKLPTTSKEKTDQIDAIQKPSTPSHLSSSSDDLIPVDSMPNTSNDMNTDDELVEIDPVAEGDVFKVPTPKKAYKARKTRKGRTEGNSRRLRSHARDTDSIFSDDELDQQYASTMTEYWHTVSFCESVESNDST